VIREVLHASARGILSSGCRSRARCSLAAGGGSRACRSLGPLVAQPLVAFLFVPGHACLQANAQRVVRALLQRAKALSPFLSEFFVPCLQALYRAIVGIFYPLHALLEQACLQLPQGEGLFRFRPPGHVATAAVCRVVAAVQRHSCLVIVVYIVG
jgi:hypothetical protein